eukprot:gene17107-22621_t
MLNELKRHNYVTPTNYLELVKGYISLLSEKRGELGASANKLGNGLAKLEDARLQVETLSKELELKKVIVAQSQKDCEDLLVQIVSERRVADEQKRHVEADSERISQEAIECKAISDDAEADLAIALPALEKAMEEVDKLDKNAISEVKAYAKPPQLVEVVLQAVMVLFNRPTDWGTAKRVLSESNFLQQIKSYDKDNITQSVVNKIKKFIDMPEFKPAKVFSVSSAAGALCSWVHAIYVYANVAKEVAPKRQRQKEAMESLELKQNALKDAQEALAIVTQKLAHLQISYDNSVNEKNRLRDEAEYLEAKLDRADKLVNGLSGEYTRWQESIGLFNISLVKVTGDALLSAAFLSYAVQKEDPNSEKKKNELTILVAKGKRQLVELEDEILKLLSESKGSLLDDEGLVNTLQQSKITSEEVTNQLIIAEETERKIDIARLSYRPSAIRAALAYFVIDDMSHIDNIEWLPSNCWETIIDLDKLPNFQGIVSSFEQMPRDWKAWYLSSKPELEQMPGDWTIKTSDLQKLCILRALRFDRVLYGCSKFISSNIGNEYVDPPSFDIESVYQTSNCQTPLIFILSPGVDPTSSIYQLANSLSAQLTNCALGQGQAPIATELIEQGIKKGTWVYLANCHLMLSWMNSLEKLIQTLIVENKPHKDFRLWLSSSPDPNFPISILQNSIKITTEPPKGLRSNLLTLYNGISEEQFSRCTQQEAYKKLLFSLVCELINEECVSSDKFMLSSLPDYYIPKDGDLKYYKDFIKGLPATDHPLAFGQHPNSDMSASIDDTNVLIQTLVSLQPRIVKVIDEDAVDPLVQQCSDLLESCPEVFDIKYVKEKLDTRADPDPLKTILFQELDRYNKLLSSISSSLSTIIKVTQGTASVTSELEDVMLSLGQLKVPRQWGTTYPSLKPLGSWYKDLKQRIDFFNSWIEESLPVCWWLPAMTYPSGFLTAILQVSARQNGLSIDSLSYDTPILTSGDKNTITSMPKDGVYVYGLFIEGGIWNYSGGYIEESRPMELISTMPIIHFKPIEGKRRGNKGYYTCPIYMYPFRSGSRERPSYVIAIELKVGKFTSDFWTKRGVALLLSTSL